MSLLLYFVLSDVHTFCCCLGEKLLPFLPGLMEKLFLLLMGDYVCISVIVCSVVVSVTDG